MYLNKTDILVNTEEIIRMAKISDETERNQIIGEKRNLLFTTLFSHLRPNVLEWLPFRGTDKILAVGSSYGAFTQMLSSKCSMLTCAEADKLSAEINALRAEANQLENVRIIAEPDDPSQIAQHGLVYDYIIFTEPFLIHTHTSPEKSPSVRKMLQYKTLLAEYGKMVFMTGNRMGLKYWSGCPDEMTGSYFSGPEGYTGLSGYGFPSRKELEETICFLDFTYREIFYPYPDHIFAMSIYSDRFLPKEGELNKNAFSWEERISLFNEVNAFNSIISNRLFPCFTNSFLAVLSNRELDGLNLFTKYSNDRSEDFSIKTSVRPCSAKKAPAILKEGLSSSGVLHVKKMYGNLENLKQLYETGNCSLNRCVEIPHGLSFEYLEGISLNQILSSFLKCGDYDGFQQLVMDFADTLRKNDTVYFYETPEFFRVFGNVSLPSYLRCNPVSNIDLIFSNILLVNGCMHIIDYEWVFDFPVPTDFILFRSIYFFFHGPRRQFNFNIRYQRKLLRALHIDEELFTQYRKMEQNFQAYVCGSHIPLRAIGTRTPVMFVPPEMRIYLNYGKGFSPSSSYTASCQAVHKNTCLLAIGINQMVTAVRIDPAECACAVQIHRIEDMNGHRLPFSASNGIMLSEDIFFSASDDPQIIIDVSTHPCLYVIAELEVNLLGNDISHALNAKWNCPEDT